MREIRTSGSTRGEWVVLMSDIAHSPTLLTLWQDWPIAHQHVITPLPLFFTSVTCNL